MAQPAAPLYSVGQSVTYLRQIRGQRALTPCVGKIVEIYAVWHDETPHIVYRILPDHLNAGRVHNTAENNVVKVLP